MKSTLKNMQYLANFYENNLKISHFYMDNIKKIICYHGTVDVIAGRDRDRQTDRQTDNRTILKEKYK